MSHNVAQTDEQTDLDIKTEFQRQTDNQTDRQRDSETLRQRDCQTTECQIATHTRTRHVERAAARPGHSVSA